MQTLQATREYRYEIAKYTCQELENLPVTSKVDEKECLRAIYKNLELPKVVNIDGISKRYDKLTKQVLIDAIYNGLAEERYNISATTNIDTEKTESIVEAVDDVTETDLGKLAEISFKAITEYAESLWHLGRYELTDSTVISITGDIYRPLSTRLSNKTGELVTPETVMRYKSIVKASVLEMIDNTKDQHHHNKYVEIFHLIYGRKTDTGYVRGELDKALRMQSITKKKNDNDNLTSRKVDQTSGNFINLYIAAIDTLNNLSPDDNPKINELWQRVAISLMLVTGRRLSEIMSSAKFSETVRFGWVMFEGQLKTKESNSEPYEIPIMVDYQIIKKAMDWLETNNKRNPDPQKAHQLYSKPLSGAIKKFNSLMEIIDSGEKTSLTCHSCRQIYAQIFKESSEIDGSPHKRISSILGHGKNDNSTADRYDADFEVKDARAILELLGRGVR